MSLSESETGLDETKVKVARPNLIQRFFILCSGAVPEVIYQCPTEWNKYSGIGATIFFTGILASISGGYALYSIFMSEENALNYSIFFGLLWGFMILNLDRFIVSSIRKEGNWKRELLQVTPRIILAVIISIVIAKPLEVRIFQDRIAQQILENERNKLAEEKLNIDKLNDLTKLANEIADLDSERARLDSLRQEDPNTEAFKNLLLAKNKATQDLNVTQAKNNPQIYQYNADISKLKADTNNYDIFRDDSTGMVISRTLKQEAKNTIWTLQKSRNQLSNQIKDKKKSLADAQADVAKARADYKAQIQQELSNNLADKSNTENIKSKADSIANLQFTQSIEVKNRSYSNNFITQLEAMGDLTESNDTMNWTSWMIMLLFIVVETSPVLVKLLSKRGCYDEKLERVEYEVYIDEQETISSLNSKVNELLEKGREAAKIEGEAFLKVEKQRLDYELQNNQKILDNIAAKQEHLAQLAIEKWYQEELSKTQRIEEETEISIEVTFENKLWTLLNMNDSVEFVFKSDNDQTLLYFENGDLSTGKWKLDSNSKKVTIEIDDLNRELEVLEVNQKSLKMRDLEDNTTLEFKA